MHCHAGAHRASTLWRFVFLVVHRNVGIVARNLVSAGVVRRQCILNRSNRRAAGRNLTHRINELAPADQAMRETVVKVQLVLSVL